MKRIYFFIALLFFVTSCKKSDFLKEKPEDRFVTGNFYSGEKDALSAVNAIYNQLYSVYLRHIIFLDLPADDEKTGTGQSDQFKIDFEYLDYTAENRLTEQMWQYNYSGIQAANSAINNIGPINMDENMKNRLIGEASFLRALFYFNLVRYYGGVPLILKLESLKDAMIPRASSEEVYNQIISDLQFAENNLPKNYNNASDIGRATSGAAKILLGKVYLTQHDFKNCADKLSEVVENEASYGYGLQADFTDNWRINTEHGNEMVFSVQYMQPPGTANILMAVEGPKYSLPGGGIPGIKGGNESIIPTIDLYNRYDSGDTRKETTFKTEYLSPTNGKIYKTSIPIFGKYWEEGETIVKNCDVDFHVIRYSDALLMYAEALNEIGNTAKAVGLSNRVRERAFHDALHDYIVSSQARIREEIYLERRLEFANEGQRWFDLVRTGRFLETMMEHGVIEAQLSEPDKTRITANARDYQFLYPIPQREMDINKLLTQNPGY